MMPGGFTFNQFLVVDQDPLLFHTGPRRMFPLVREAVTHVLGDVRNFATWPSRTMKRTSAGRSTTGWRRAWAEPVCSMVGAMVSVNDMADRPPRPLADGAELSLGQKRLRWLDAPNLPHNWECGYMFEATTRTLLCGDLFTHGGHQVAPITETEVLSPAEAMRKEMGGVAIEKDTRILLDKLASTEPTTLALMHGSSYRGDGAKLLRALGDALGV